MHQGFSISSSPHENVTLDLIQYKCDSHWKLFVHKETQVCDIVRDNRKNIKMLLRPSKSHYRWTIVGC